MPNSLGFLQPDKSGNYDPTLHRGITDTYAPYIAFSGETMLRY